MACCPLVGLQKIPSWVGKGPSRPTASKLPLVCPGLNNLSVKLVPEPLSGPCFHPDLLLTVLSPLSLPLPSGDNVHVLCAPLLLHTQLLIQSASCLSPDWFSSQFTPSNLTDSVARPRPPTPPPPQINKSKGQNPQPSTGHKPVPSASTVFGPLHPLPSTLGPGPSSKLSPCVAVCRGLRRADGASRHPPGLGHCGPCQSPADPGTPHCHSPSCRRQGHVCWGVGRTGAGRGRGKGA